MEEIEGERSLMYLCRNDNDFYLMFKLSGDHTCLLAYSIYCRELTWMKNKKGVP